MERVKLTPDADRLQADCEVFLSSHQETTVQIHAHTQIEGMEYSFGTQEMICREGYGRAVLAFPDLDFRRDYFFWTPEHPNLIDVDVSVGKEDQVFVYFGMRKIIQHHGRFVLNDKEYFQRLVLDQGYWPDTLMTPPSRKALQEDIRLAKAMGFNGVRKHQKIEDPAFYYYADQLGLLVWGELPSCYAYNDRMVQRSIREMTEFLERDFNHPCIVAWVPVNESWGVRQVWANEKQQHYVQMMLHLLKAMDHTRLVNGNDGWEQVSQTDFCTVHDYTLMPHNTQKYADLERALDGIVEQRIVFASGHRYQGQAVVLSEYGGIAFRGEKDEEWGYYGKVDSEEAFFARLEPVTDYVIQSGQFAGFCYTQLTDVMQEANGLLTQDRRPKVELKRLKKIFSKSIRGEREANQR